LGFLPLFYQQLCSFIPTSAAERGILFVGQFDAVGDDAGFELVFSAQGDDLQQILADGRFAAEQFDHGDGVHFTEMLENLIEVGQRGVEIKSHVFDGGDADGAVHVAAVGDVEEYHIGFVVPGAAVAVEGAALGGDGGVGPDIAFGLPGSGVGADQGVGAAAGGAVLFDPDLVMAEGEFRGNAGAALIAQAEIFFFITVLLLGAGRIHWQKSFPGLMGAGGSGPGPG